MDDQSLQLSRGSRDHFGSIFPGKNQSWRYQSLFPWGRATVDVYQQSTTMYYIFFLSSFIIFLLFWFIFKNHLFSSLCHLFIISYQFSMARFFRANWTARFAGWWLKDPLPQLQFLDISLGLDPLLPGTRIGMVTDIYWDIWWDITALEHFIEIISINCLSYHRYDIILFCGFSNFFQPATCQKPVMFGGGNFVSGAAIARLKLDLHRWLGFVLICPIFIYFW